MTIEEVIRLAESCECACHRRGAEANEKYEKATDQEDRRYWHEKIIANFYEGLGYRGMVNLIQGRISDEKAKEMGAK